MSQNGAEQFRHSCPNLKGQVGTKKELSCLVKGHLVPVLAAKLGESINSLVDLPIIGNLLPARSLAPEVMIEFLPRGLVQRGGGRHHEAISANMAIVHE